MMLESGNIYNMDCLVGMSNLEDESIDLVVTSPPYNIGIDYNTYEDTKTNEEYEIWIKQVYRELYRIIKPKGIVAINVGNQRNSGLPHKTYFMLKEAKFNIIKEIFWYKGPYYIQGETIFVCVKNNDGEFNNRWKENKMEGYSKQMDGYFCNQMATIWKMTYEEDEEVAKIFAGISPFSSVWQMTYRDNQSRQKLEHNAFFVEQLPTNFILINTLPGEVVLDPFMGTGTTAVACVREGRKYIGFETDTKYYEGACKRISETKPKVRWNKPTLQATL